MEGENEKHLFKICMEGRWERVVEIYKEDERVHTFKITRAGESALHVAVADGQEEVVSQLVAVLRYKTPEALKMENKRKNTALHFAASMGTLNMIRDIAHAHPSLLSFRNVDGETPIFLAAFHGRNEAFMALHSISPHQESSCTRTSDVNTILHCAIAADHFDLAFQIIKLYGNLINMVNRDGATPLHILANKPNAFRSGNHLGRFETFIYHGISVKELKAETNYDQQQPTLTDKGVRRNFPKNYEACIDLMMVMKKVVSVVTTTTSLKNCRIIPFARKDKKQDPDEEAPEKTAATGVQVTNSSSTHPLFPTNYKCCVDFLKFVLMAVLVIFGKGTFMVKKIRQKKEKHVWSVQIMNELLKKTCMYEYDGSVGTPNAQEQGIIIPTPILIAAKNGITEMVEKILEMFPVAVHDMDSKKKNIVLLAVENRQTHLYELLLKKKAQRESLFRKVDDEGNSALHLAAKLGNYKPWLIPGEALQMHWEIKWYYFVKESMKANFFRHYNNENKSPRDIFDKTHKQLVESGGEWLRKTSESCSLVAALIATVAFATSSTVPGGVHESNGVPTLENTSCFKVFAISSLIALANSVAAVLLFLSILTSRYEKDDFGKNLPRKLILGLTTLFMSITAMLVSFCSGHYLVLSNKIRSAALPMYAVTCLPVTIFAVAQVPLYIDLIWATFKKVPQRSYKST